MKIKNLVVAAVAAVCVLAMVGCAGKPAETTAAPTTEATTEAPAPYKAGTYTATAKGMGDVTVTLTIDEKGVITECVVETPNETPGIGVEAGAKLGEAVVAAQSAEIDAIGGASITSGAVIAAVTDCLTQAAN